MKNIRGMLPDYWTSSPGFALMAAAVATFVRGEEGAYPGGSLGSRPPPPTEI